MNTPVLIAGPTASGKSQLAMKLAERDKSCIINADALQVYDGWRILTARPDAADEKMVVHRLFGTVPMRTAYSVGDWLRDLAGVLAECRKKKLRPVIVGGTGLYFSALTEGLSEIPPVPEHIRAQANRMRLAGGSEAFLSELEISDPASLERIDRNNPMRLQRAWEVLAATGRSLAAWHKDRPDALLAIADVHAVVLNAKPDWLNRRIETRLEHMLSAGLLDECAAVLATGWDPELPSARALGAADFIAKIQGLATMDEAVARTIVKTRQYAKRQRTWFRGRMRNWKHLDAEADAAELVAQIGQA